MRSTFIALAMLASASGCSTAQPIESIPQAGSISRSITWVMSEDAENLCAQALGKPLIGTYRACARLNGNQCTIYVKPPRNEDDRTAIYILGHEALHCFVGHFHYASN